MAKFGFDTTEVDVNEQGIYDPIPAGEYTLQAVEAEEKPTANGTGSYIKVKFEVAKGQFSGRLLWFNFNIHNASEKAQRIGRQQLVAWATACGKPDADDTDKLVGKPFLADVNIVKGTGGYADSNGIKAFLFAESSAPAKRKEAPVAAPAQTSGNPWD